MKVINCLLVLVLAVMFSACAGTDITSGIAALDTGEIVSTATDRFGSWERVNTQIAKTEKAKAVARTEEAKAAQAVVPASEPVVTIVIKSADAMESYERTQSTKALARANELLGQANDTMGDIAVALAEKDKPVTSDYIAFPQGAFAETIDAFGTGVAKIGNTPTSIAIGVGKGLGALFSEVDTGGDKVDTGGGAYNKETQESSASGEGSSISNNKTLDYSTDTASEEE